MKKLMRYLFILFCLIPGILSAAVAQDTVPSKIRSVTLFADQALVTREAKVSVHKGLNEIFVGVDAFSVDTDSVSAKVFGKGELYSVQLKTIYLEKAPQENIKALEKKLKDLKTARTAITDDMNVLKNKERFLESVIDFSKTQVPQDMKTSFPKTEDLFKTMSFLGQNFEDILKKRQVLVEKTSEIDDKIHVVEKELSSIGAGSSKEIKVIEILFNAQNEQTVNISASYLTYNAHWEPLYKASVPTDLKSVDLTMFAKLNQKTGEQWQDIDLSISNVVPLRGAALPDTPPWMLDIVRPMTRAKRQSIGFENKAAAPALEALKEMDADAFASEPKKEMEAAFVSAKTNVSPLSFEYQMPQNLTIESKDKTTLLPLFSKTIKGEFLHYAVPKTSPAAFLICKATTDKELLSGPMNVHLGPHFIGKTFLNAKNIGETFDLNLGTDREIKIQHEKITDKVKETFLGSFERNTVIREMAFKIKIENLKDKAILVNVLDSIPVSRTDKIKVEDIKFTPQPTENNYKDRQGVLRWLVSVNPKAVKEINISFTINYPKDTPVSGL
ncbi:MAG: mucoidy inhibitor MuiA family protein [Proteobacteria bacterium]|nr:mucoidy inhibitor MuiA family protein [Pseudomonadota bacterium]MBU4034892.1 mucoidy inhibitor MuiA family protein [Pseudomonadota bacterium]